MHELAGSAYSKRHRFCRPPRRSRGGSGRFAILLNAAASIYGATALLRTNNSRYRGFLVFRTACISMAFTMLHAGSSGCIQVNYAASALGRQNLVLFAQRSLEHGKVVFEGKSEGPLLHSAQDTQSHCHPPWRSWYVVTLGQASEIYSADLWARLVTVWAAAKAEVTTANEDSPTPATRACVRATGPN